MRPDPPPLVDTHCHLAFDAFDADRQAVVDRAREAGVVGCVAVAVDARSARAALELADALPGWVVASAGIHPNEPRAADPDEFAAVTGLLESGRFAAVGETGLDAYRHSVPLPVQRASLERHLDLARRVGRPVILHCREAFAELRLALGPWIGSGLRGVVHCFTGRAEDAGHILEAGLHIGVGGVATYKANGALRDVLREVPLGRLLLETDAPFLAPVPRRGRRNEPAFVADVASALAATHGVQVEHVAEVTTRNARQLFGLAGPG